MKEGLNIGCGNRVKKSNEFFHWINVDKYERKNKLDHVIDIIKFWPFEHDKYDFIYAEQFIEHLDWLKGRGFLLNCFMSLKEDGCLRLVLPHYKKIFQKYLENDWNFFEPFFEGLNEGDYPYYYSVFLEPERIEKERRDNPPPKWHLSQNEKDRHRVELRIKHYTHLIELVNWFTHQYQEHLTLYDFDYLKDILHKIGFKEVYETDIKDIDSHEPTRITSSLYVEAIK